MGLYFFQKVNDKIHFPYKFTYAKLFKSYPCKHIALQHFEKP